MAEEIFSGQTFDVEGEDGTRLKVSLAPASSTNRVQRNLSGQMGSGQNASGFYEQKEKKVKMYQGATPSWIPVGQFQRHLSRGFTVAPTAEPPARPFECGTVRSDGTVCSKAFISRLHRLRHIKAAHADASMFVLTDDEQALLSGDLTAARRIVPESEREHTEIDIDALIQERAKELAEQMIAKEKLEQEKAEEQERKAQEQEQEVEITFGKIEHTCNAKGRFGRVDPNCAACRAKMMLNTEGMNGES